MPKSPEGPAATLGDEICAGLDIRAICLECQHTSVLSARELAKRLGEGFQVRRLIGRLRCHKCTGGDGEMGRAVGGKVAGDGARTFTIGKEIF